MRVASVASSAAVVNLTSTIVQAARTAAVRPRKSYAEPVYDRPYYRPCYRPRMTVCSGGAFETGPALCGMRP